MKKLISINLLVLGLILFGCKSQMMVSEKTKDMSETLKNPSLVKKGIMEHNLNDTTISLKNLKIKYNSEKVSHKLYGAAKLIQDSVILVSLRAPLGIEISRVLFRPEEVLVLDRKGNRFLAGDYSYLRNRFDLDLNFNLIYSLLLGNFPRNYQFFEKNEDLETSSSSLTQDSLYVGEFFHSTGENYKFRLWAHSSFKRPEAFIFYKKRNLKDFSIQYIDYVKNSKFYIPSKLKIEGGAENNSYTIDIDYRNIELSSDKQISFDVPSGFKKIYLK